MTYQDVLKVVLLVKQKVETRVMPPWHIDRSIGEYVADPSLSDDEIATIVAWVEAGAYKFPVFRPASCTRRTSGS